ncbi:MAG: hypothetical protein UZ15_CFX003002853 [Chloroflexi bacterium OLB15]|nr:MAG: hypothetical protein UZ15_CFX003002853 [Chloroflexi bacterium OLB15]
MRRVLWLSLFLLWGLHAASAQTPPAFYAIGDPALLEIWVDGANGSDSSSGESRDQALATISAAWARIPQTMTNTGYAIRVLPGQYPAESLPNYWESRHGTFEYPILIEAVEGRDTVTFSTVNIFDVRYLYFVNINFSAENDPFHCEACQYLLLRGVRVSGADPETYATQEAVKINQSQHIYIEDSDISGAWDNAVDFVAVQHGHALNNRIHRAGDWCMYAKGGSADFLIENNEFYDCGTGGFTAGQGTGFQFMVPPWIQYEAYDIRFINNIVHDTQGAGVGVMGGFNILIAGNTFYRVGERSHVLEVAFGSRSCDGLLGDEGRERCDQFREAGGWGGSQVDDGENYVRIPNRHVFIYNNVIYNPPGFQSAYQQFFIPAPYGQQPGTNVSAPALADDDLQIRGNIIWNGSAEMPLGIEANPDSPAGCQADNPTCNQAQLRADNLINQVEPVMVDPENGNFDLLPGIALPTQPIPEFTQHAPA